MKKEVPITSMSDIEAKAVDWLWYPYIPLGKITIIQGDPGEGKTTFVLAVIAALTQGETLPGCSYAMEPMNVIYQTAEDGLADTIKPRLVAAGADFSRVKVIEEGSRELTLVDERLEQAIRQTGARLIVLDPIQAYLGSCVDMHRANEVRPVMKRLADMAERTDCAVVLVGHINKAQGMKASYRRLGSIDFLAAARSVLVVGRLKNEPEVRVVAQSKSSLAPEARSIVFTLTSEQGFQWGGFCDATVDDVLSGTCDVQSADVSAGSVLRCALDAVLRDRDRFIGTPTELVEHIGTVIGEAISPKKISREVLQTAAALAELGITATCRRSNGKRLIELRRADSADYSECQNIDPIDPAAAQQARCPPA